jgi:Uma2 family endonuclease
MSAAVVQHYRWRRQEFDHMIEAGIFHPEARLELIDGEIFCMAPQSSLHATAIRLVEEALRSVFVSTYDGRVQMPLAMDDNSEPEPDIAIVPGSPRDYRSAHPTTAVLVVEVADKSLTFDRDKKLKLYARNGIREYWILNLIEFRLELYRDPGYSVYQSQRCLQSGDSVTPLAGPDHSIKVSDLLP